jgi:hypothetical protein
MGGDHKNRFGARQSFCKTYPTWGKRIWLNGIHGIAMSKENNRKLHMYKLNAKPQDILEIKKGCLSSLF